LTRANVKKALCIKNQIYGTEVIIKDEKCAWFTEGIDSDVAGLRLVYYSRGQRDLGKKEQVTSTLKFVDRPHNEPNPFELR
jgi:hypothetical protein